MLSREDVECGYLCQDLLFEKPPASITAEALFKAEFCELPILTG